jgi:cellobiose dehydrogenase (acceptor)
MSNFKLMMNTNVVRAVRNSSLVSGIEVDTGSSTRQIININTGGKVILAAGALSTPRILFNSGIGPKAQIQKVQNGTKSVTLPPSSTWIELPVGENLMDHPIFTVSLTTTSSLYALPSTSFTAPNITNIDLFAQGSGLLAQSGQRLNFWTTATATSDNATRYIQATCNAPSNNTVKAKVYLTHGLTSSGVLEIDSSGSTTITTQPYLTTAGDKEAILNFMNRLIGYATQSNSTLTMASNTTAEDLISSYTTGSHFVGTARMGTSNDGTSVVDTDTKVWGTDNLYVVDASMHPDLPTGNTQAIVMVAAEQAATKILSSSGTSSNSTTSSGASGSGSGSTVPSGAGTNSTTSSGSGSGSSKCKRKRRIVYVEATS